jgi:hypothetical protein
LSTFPILGCDIVPLIIKTRGSDQGLSRRDNYFTLNIKDLFTSIRRSTKTAADQRRKRPPGTTLARDTPIE